MMIAPFRFEPNWRVVFEAGSAGRLGRRLAELTSSSPRVVVITDPGLIRAGLAERVLGSLAGPGLDHTLFSEVRPDPTSLSIDLAAEVVRDFKATCVVGLGGGSAMDVAKMAAAAAGGDSPAASYSLMAKPLPERKVMTVMLPTTAGTGAEVTRTVVFSDAGGRKVWAWGEELAPDLAVLDPELSLSLPPEITVETALDALVHAIEASTNRNSNPMVRALGLQAVRLVPPNLEAVLVNPSDLEARSNLALAACLAGMAIDAAGTGLAHGMGHALSTLAGIGHGRAVSLAMARAYPWNAVAAVPAFAEVARALGVGEEGGSREELALAGAEAFGRLVRRCGLRTRLSEDGLSPADLERLVEACLAPENQTIISNNCREVGPEDLARIGGEVLGLEPNHEDHRRKRRALPASP